MYGLPDGFDANVLTGRTLDQVCIAVNQLALRFDDNVQITLEGPFSYQDERDTVDGDAQSLSDESVAGVMRLLGHHVVEAEAGKDGTLSLVFETGDVLKCLDIPQYESYHIRYGDRVIVV